MPIVNYEIFKEGDIIRKNHLNGLLKLIQGGDGDTPGVYGGKTDKRDGFDNENFREGGLDRRTLHFDGSERESIFSDETSYASNTGDINLHRNANTDWHYVESSNIDNNGIFVNRAGIKIPWDPEIDQYVIIRRSAYIDTYDTALPPITGSDMWDLGLYIIPPGFEPDHPLPKFTNTYGTADVSSPTVWPYQRVCINDAFSRNFILIEPLTSGWDREKNGNTLMEGFFPRNSRFNASFQLNYAARSGRSKTQAGVSPPLAGMHLPPRWNKSGFAYAYLVYRNAVKPDEDWLEAETGAGVEALDAFQFALGREPVPLRSLRMSHTTYRR